MCRVPSLEATSHPSPRGVGCTRSMPPVSSRSKAGDSPLRDTTAQTPRTPAYPCFPAGGSDPGEAEGFSTLEPEPWHSGSCTLGGTTPGTSTGLGWTCWRAALWRGTGSAGGRQADHEPAVCPGCQEGQWDPGVH